MLRVLYSTNTFFIRRRDAGNLDALQNLSPDALSSLTHLKVHLNTASCIAWSTCCDASARNMKNCEKHDKSLRVSSPRGQAILHEWQRTANRLMSHIMPSNLQLHFICDVEDLGTAAEVVKPLLSIKSLANCAVRLGRYPDPHLQNLAYQTAVRAMGHPEETPVFRFLDLPWELRQRILEHTDLVTPLREIEWNPREGFYLRYSTVYCDERPELLERACHFPTYSDRARTGCFCRRSHAAYSSQCRCWSPPKPLFLVCRILLEESRMVFFQKNRFVITPSTGCTDSIASTPDRLELSRFLTDIVSSDALRFLRFLEVVFPPCHGDYLRLDEPAYADWLRAIRHIKEHLNLPLLTLRVYMVHHFPGMHGILPIEGRLTPERAKRAFELYVRALKPLAEMKGLKAFFTHLGWPWGWTQNNRRLPHPNPASDRARMLEQKIEHLVMGSDYNSMALKKEEPRNSQWAEDCLGPWA